jgi:hypothetical protein
MNFVIALTALCVTAIHPSLGLAQAQEISAASKAATQRYWIARPECDRKYQPLPAEKYAVAYIRCVNAAEETVLPYFLAWEAIFGAGVSSSAYSSLSGSRPVA